MSPGTRVQLYSRTDTDPKIKKYSINKRTIKVKKGFTKTFVCKIKSFVT